MTKNSDSKHSKAAGKDSVQADFKIRLIERRDNAQVAAVIRKVMTEFGAVGEGYSIRDAEVDDMYGNYRDCPDSRSFYYVIVDDDDTVYGGGGIAPLQDGAHTTCELRKMFFLSELRGIGMGTRLLSQLLDEAKSCGYTKCYLETLDRMDQAISLYEKNGFQRLEESMGNTGHSSCERHYARDL